MNSDQFVIFGNKDAQSKIKDFGNISTSCDNSIDQSMKDLYDFRYQMEIELPFNIINEQQQTHTSRNIERNPAKHVDLTVLTRVLMPHDQLINNENNNKIWTFDSIVNDLQVAVQDTPTYGYRF
eukprot:618259_1